MEPKHETFINVKDVPLQQKKFKNTGEDQWILYGYNKKGNYVRIREPEDNPESKFIKFIKLIKKYGGKLTVLFIILALFAIVIYLLFIDIKYAEMIHPKTE